MRHISTLSLNVSHDLIAPNVHMRGHGHAVSHLCIVLDGDFDEDLGKRVAHCAQGVARLSPGGVSHDLQFGSLGGTCLVLEGRGRFWKRAFGAKRSPDPHRYAKVNGKHIEALRSIRSTNDLIASKDAITALGHTLAATGHVGESHPPVWIEESLDAFESLTGAATRVRRIATSARIHPVQFAREFWSYTGWRPVEYRALTRARAAVGLIVSSDMPIAEISIACGYTHQSHMTNAFSVLLGVSPASLRN